MEHFNWTRIAILTQDEDLFIEVSAVMLYMIKLTVPELNVLNWFYWTSMHEPYLSSLYPTLSSNPGTFLTLAFLHSASQF